MNNQSANAMQNTIQNQSAAYVQKVHLLAQSASAAYDSHLTLLEIVSVALSAILIGAVIYFMIETGWLATRVDRVRDVILKTNLPKKKTTKAWAEVQEHFFTGSDNDLKVAIIEADKVLDDALRSAGIRGATLGDRLKKIKPSQLPDIDAIWEVHKLRNQIAHENDYQLKRDLAERALGVYEKALRELKALD